MKVLLVGSGGREHALAWALSASPLLTKLYCAPGNAGIAQVAECVPIPAMDFPALVAFASAAGFHCWLTRVSARCARGASSEGTSMTALTELEKLALNNQLWSIFRARARQRDRRCRAADFSFLRYSLSYGDG